MFIKSPIAEKEFIEGCGNGVEKYCKLLFDSYYGVMLGLCRRYTTEPEEARDILQEGFIKIFKYIGQYQFNGSFEGWMKRIMVNTAIDHYKKSIRQPMIGYLNDEEADRTDLPDHMYEDEFPVDPGYLLTLVQQLPLSYRLVFNLNIVEGYSHKKIGELLGISESASRSNLTKAKQKIRMQLKNLKRESRNSYAV